MGQISEPKGYKETKKNHLPLLRSLEQKQGTGHASFTQYHLRVGARYLKWPFPLTPGHTPVLCLLAPSHLILCDSMHCSPPGSSVHGDSPGKNTGVGCHALLQGIFPSQGSNPGLLHCRQILYHLSHQGSPRILQWVACPFFRGSGQPRNRIGVSCIAGIFFTSWATREAQEYCSV